ncbi:MarR family transcriptional regulator [Rhodococcus kroppenstedtii]|uniref:DNA-binding transcriptional regulator, MarR family n=1 Tax=Rhodococcoides kroppenstedtii TaxID=293050 RepID=A0A1I0U2E5_9NOCA|nr:MULTISPECIES: MarR family transcriptional regulator [Rhodococcus]AMY18202.1 putative HTH-type transcriptional regulator YusO [Rhodococcus sp. PBTS 1]MBT1193776.1 MarR family transcriptional regulator [Rhodococcus kroppenstedtii]MBY6313795.1 MarR family transcriptional regulator [Rhodococcus kroppenstedtii]MBY6320111.1 MarR family transcriptional regulator [Rhodococcus kroppenstedtii]MBY6399050.1 MarR family transcriptional regulator [Rhodococcus kroppenstedtii]
MPSAPKLPLDPIAEAHRQWVRHGWTDAADGMAAVTSIMRVQQIMMARVDEVLKPTGLTFARYELLTLLTFTRTGALPMAKASARLQVHPTSVTNAVDRLEKAGLVTRVPHPTDRRTTLVEITDSGRRLAVSATEQLNDRVFGDPGVAGRELDSLVAILAGVRRRAGDFDDEDDSGW